jgi:glucose-1-phosphate cytidylyltransferase
VKVIILAGGMGTRFSEETELRPKPMIEIGGRPILWHIMKHYSFHGFEEFVLALGYKADMIKRYFLDYARINSSFTVQLGSGDILRHCACRDEWTVHLVDTGLQTMTGGRLKRLTRHIGPSTFMMTYGDGVSNVDVKKVLDFHRAHGKLATVTAVRPPARYGSLMFEGDKVVEFAEKPITGDGWINGGFFVLEPAVLDYIDGDDTHWEGEPLERLARDRELVAYRHADFWQSMDTLRDHRLLESLWASGKAPWRMWQ